MHPFGSGAPNNWPNNNSQPPYGSSYPRQPQPGYPSVQPPSMYPGQPMSGPPGQPGFSFSNNSGYPIMPMPYGGHFAPPPASYQQQQQQPHLASGYPPSGYPPAPHQQPPSMPLYPGSGSVSQTAPFGNVPQPNLYPNMNVNYGNPNPEAPHISQTTEFQYSRPAHPITVLPNKNPEAPHISQTTEFQYSRPAHPITVLPNKKGTPTVFHVQSDAREDAAALRKAMKGFGTDENTLINVLCRRSNEQRQEIARTFKTSYGKDLIEDIKSETSGNFENLLVALLTSTLLYYVKELHSAISGLGTDEDALVETLCTLSNHEINAIKDLYLRTYGNTLEDDLISDTSGHFKRLMVSLCAANRDESGSCDFDAAVADAKSLQQAGELMFGTDESLFNMILCQRNYQQLKLVIEQYQQISGNSLEDAIKSEYSGDIKDGLLAIVRCVMNQAEYFARRLHASMQGLGTKDKQLIRLVVTRCEIDMGDIKDAFQRLYGDSLKNWIKGDTSGHYKHALYVLIGENKS